MRRLSIREDFGLHGLSHAQRKNTEQQDRVREVGEAAVRRMFPNGQVSSGVAQSLAVAVSRLERCREQDTDDRGVEHPSPITRGTLDLGVPESMKHLPQRRSAFEISPEGRTDAEGNLKHKWDPEKSRWVPTKYAHGR